MAGFRSGCLQFQQNNALTKGKAHAIPNKFCCNFGKFAKLSDTDLTGHCGPMVNLVAPKASG
jgi:hypothetical protein